MNVPGVVEHLCPSQDFRCLVVGEVGQAHDGSLGTAHAFIDLIADTGADAVKFQVHIAAAESTPAEPWRVDFSYQDAARYDYWRRMEFDAGQWAGLRMHAADRGLLFIASPFSEAAIDLLKPLSVDAWKVASGEVGNGSLLAALAATRVPTILSSGMSGWNEISLAVKLFHDALVPVTVLQCNTEYPCPPENVGLNALMEIKESHGWEAGLSDHSGTIFPGISAATLGARLIEVHVTLSRKAFGPDVVASLTEDQLVVLVEGVRFIERCRANPVDKDESAALQEKNRAIFGRSVVAAKDLPRGHTVVEKDFIAKKPGTGIPADQLGSLVGTTLRRGISADELPQWQDFEGLGR